MNSLLIFSLFSLIISSYALTPTEIPFLGTYPLLSLPSTSVSYGQVFTKVSQLSTFTFYALGGSSGIATATLALWGENNVPVSELSKVDFEVSPSFEWTPYTIEFNVEGMEPLDLYVVYITFSSGVVMQVATNNTHPGLTGGLVTSIDNIDWTFENPSDMIFEITSTSTMVLHHLNYAEGPSSTLGCGFRSVYTAIQVDWIELKINTGYFANSTTSPLFGINCPSYAPVPYGTAANCSDTYYSNAVIDLRGTRFQIKDSFETAGHNVIGDAKFGHNDQVVEMYATGTCGWIATRDANSAGEAEAIRMGGMYIHIIPL